MAKRVLANSVSILTPPTMPAFDITGDMELVVNTTPVGYPVGKISRKADIQLIQFFLWEFFETNPGVTIPIDFPRSKNGDLMTVDGIIGGQTNKAIEVFQKHLYGKASDKIISQPSVQLTGKEKPEVSGPSFIQARSVLVLAATWVVFHPGMDILDSRKLQNANELKRDLLLQTH